MYVSQIPMPNDMKMWIVFHHGVKPVHLAIQWVTKKPGWKMRDTPNHVSLGFGFVDSEKPEFIIEAAGPLKDTTVRSWKRVCDEMEHWGANDWIEAVELSLPPAEAWYIYEQAHELVGNDTQYATWQLIQIYLSIRLGLPIPSSPDRMVCSELVSRCLQLVVDLPTYCGKPSHDYITPADIMEFVEDEQQEVADF
jgi:hypothetical protein